MTDDTRTGAAREGGAAAMLVTVALVSLAGTACASLGLEGLVRRPTLEQADARASRLRVLPPERGRPAGGAELRVWTRIENPNRFGIDITNLAGDLILEGLEGIEFVLPLGLPLEAGADTVVPLDLSVGFAEVPELLSEVTRAALVDRAVEVALRGVVEVDAGRFGDVSFGPLTFLSAEVPVLR